MKNKVYISGAIAHYEMVERRAAFQAAALRLKEQGFEPKQVTATRFQLTKGE